MIGLANIVILLITIKFVSAGIDDSANLGDGYYIWSNQQFVQSLRSGGFDGYPDAMMQMMGGGYSPFMAGSNSPPMMYGQSNTFGNLGMIPQIPDFSQLMNNMQGFSGLSDNSGVLPEIGENPNPNNEVQGGTTNAAPNANMVPEANVNAAPEINAAPGMSSDGIANSILGASNTIPSTPSIETPEKTNPVSNPIPATGNTQNPSQPSSDLDDI